MKTYYWESTKFQCPMGVEPKVGVVVVAKLDSC